MMPSFAYSQLNAVFKTIRADTVKITTLIVEDSTSIQTSDIERVVDKYMDKTSEALKGLAEALQVPADHVYGILIKQQLLLSVSWMIFFLFGIAGIFTVTRIILFMVKQDYDEFAMVLTGVLGGAASLIVTIVGLVHTEVILTGFINPEYGAIKEISNIIK